MNVEQVSADIDQAKLKLEEGWQTTLEADQARTKVAEGLATLFATLKDLTVAPLQEEWTTTEQLVGAAEGQHAEGRQILETATEGAEHPAAIEAKEHTAAAHDILAGNPQDPGTPPLPGLFALGKEDLEFIEAQLGAVRDRITTALGHTADVQGNFAEVAGGINRFHQHVPGQDELAINAATEYQQAILSR